MKKLFVMLVVMAVVFGMSAGVMAQLKSEDLDAAIKINQYVDLNIGEARDVDNNTFDGTPTINVEYFGTDPGGTGMNSKYAIYWPFSVRSNSNIGVLLEENISNNIKSNNTETIKIWPYTDAAHDMAINLSLFNEHRSHKATDMPSELSGNSYIGSEHLGSGVNNWTLGLNADVTSKGMDKINPDTYTGTVTVTVYAE